MLWQHQRGGVMAAIGIKKNGGIGMAGGVAGNNAPGM